MPEYDLWAEKICHIYLARPLRAVAAPSEPDHAAIWADAGLAPGLLASAGDRAFLRRVLAAGRQRRP
jgi:8-oxo-dGTP diphosphatase